MNTSSFYCIMAFIALSLAGESCASAGMVKFEVPRGQRGRLYATDDPNTRPNDDSSFARTIGDGVGGGDGESVGTPIPGTNRDFVVFIVSEFDQRRNQNIWAAVKDANNDWQYTREMYEAVGDLPVLEPFYLPIFFPDRSINLLADIQVNQLLASGFVFNEGDVYNVITDRQVANPVQFAKLS